MTRILRDSPSTFDNQRLMLQRWKKGMNVGNVQMDYASLWVQIWGAPFDMVSPQVATDWVWWRRWNGEEDKMI